MLSTLPYYILISVHTYITDLTSYLFFFTYPRLPIFLTKKYIYLQSLVNISLLKNRRILFFGFTDWLWPSLPRLHFFFATQWIEDPGLLTPSQFITFLFNSSISRHYTWLNLLFLHTYHPHHTQRSKLKT